MFSSLTQFNEGAAEFITDPYSLHTRLQMAFPTPERLVPDRVGIAAFHKEYLGDDLRGTTHARRSETKNYLYRIDAAPAGPVLMLQSGIEPDFDAAFDTIRPYVRDSITRPLSFAHKAGQHYVFTIRLAPLGNTQDGRHPLLNAKEACDLLRYRLAKAGELTSVREVSRNVLDVIHCKAGDEVARPYGLVTADYSGVIKVRNSWELRKAMIQGLGRGKHLGCGLLLVRSVRID